MELPKSVSENILSMYNKTFNYKLTRGLAMTQSLKARLTTQTKLAREACSPSEAGLGAGLAVKETTA